MKFESFIDIHNHIIYGFDDGPESFEVVKRMLDVAVEQNVSIIFATSHFQEHANQKLLDEYYSKLKETNEYIKANNLPVKIFPGAEIFQHEGIEKSAFSFSNYRLNEESRYILFEFPMFHTVNNYLDTIFKLRLKKLRPIVAHPERYQMVYKDFSSLIKMVNMGALIQVNCGSILGHFGTPVKEIVNKMLEYKLVHFIASDAHSERGRTFKMQETYDYCKPFVSEDYLNQIFYENQQKIILNEDIEPLVPEIDEKQNSFKNKIFKILKFKE